MEGGALNQCSSSVNQVVITALYRQWYCCLQMHLINQLLNQELQGGRFRCYGEGFRMSKKVHQMPAPSPKVAQLRYHQCRTCSGMAAGRRECVCTKTFEGWPGVKKGNKEATSLQEKSGADWCSAKGTGFRLLRTGVKSFSLMNPGKGKITKYAIFPKMKRKLCDEVIDVDIHW